VYVCIYIYIYVYTYIYIYIYTYTGLTLTLGPDPPLERAQLWVRAAAREKTRRLYPEVTHLAKGSP